MGKRNKKKMLYADYDGILESTKYNYVVGDFIRFNSSHKMKCVEVVKEDDKIIYYFKKGRVVFD